MDYLSLQRSLTNLEERYSELREAANLHYNDWKIQEKDLKQQLSDKDLSLESLLSTQNDLKQQLSDKDLSLESLLSTQNDLKKQLSDKDLSLESLLSTQNDLKQQLSESEEELEFTLLQLHQVQEELEHYFLLSKNNNRVERYIELDRKAKFDVVANWKRSRAERSSKIIMALGKKILSCTYNN